MAETLKVLRTKTVTQVTSTAATTTDEAGHRLRMPPIVAGGGGWSYLRLQDLGNDGDFMLSGEALDIAFALRAQVGALAQGDGPILNELRQTSGLAEREFARAVAELESVGFVRIERRSASEAAVIVLAPLQIYLDDLEGQGTDDL